MKLTQNERSGKVLRLYTEVIQLPLSEYVNTKSNPPFGFYGYVTLWAKEFVYKKIPIEFQQQLVLYEERYSAQLGEQVVCNAMELLKGLVIISEKIPGPTNVVYLQPSLIEYPLWAVTDLKFTLVPGCVIKASFGEELNQKCAASPIVQPDLLPPDSIPAPPPPPPPAGTPDDQKIPLSPPYAGANDNGDTFVRPPAPPPPGPNEARQYRVVGTAKASVAFSDGNRDVNASYEGILTGPIQEEPDLNKQITATSCESKLKLVGASTTVTNVMNISGHICGTYTYEFTYTPL